MATRRQPKICESLKTEKPKSRQGAKRKQENKAPLSSPADILDSSEYSKVKQALHLSKPQALPCRDDQVNEIYTFIFENLWESKSGSMYISGAPGTGKTAVVQHVMDRLTHSQISDLKFVSIFINCMNMTSPQSIFKAVYEPLNRTTKVTKGNDIKERIAKRVVATKGHPILLVLDEMDQLLSKSTEVLYTIFEWTRLPGSKLTLIGIANSLDLTVKHLPMLTASPKSSSPRSRTRASKQAILQTAPPPEPCKLIQFAPYEREDIERILESRINEFGSHLFEQTAIKFVAAKVAATTGDVRKALNACQEALEKNERSQRPILKETADDGFNSSSPKKRCSPEKKIGAAALSKILGPQKDDGVLPLQQRIILATLLKINKSAPTSLVIPNDGVLSAIPITKFYDEYRKICTAKGLSWIDRSELSSVCGLLENRSLVHVVITNPLSKVKLSVKTKEGIFFDERATRKILGNDPIVASIIR